MNNNSSHYSVTLKHVSKTFRIPHEKRSTVRENVVNLFRHTEYETFNALTDISLEVPRGEFLGIVGKNGSGKSTMLKLITGIYPPTSGTLEVRGIISPFLELGVGFHPELTARDNVYLYGTILGIPKERIRARFDAIIAFAELEKFIDTRLKNFSSGMWVRLAFAVAIELDADIFIVDEVLAVGDKDFQDKCFTVFRRFREQGKTVILVSHDISLIEALCDRCIHIDHGVIAHQGNPADVLRAYTAKTTT